MKKFLLLAALMSESWWPMCVDYAPICDQPSWSYTYVVTGESLPNKRVWWGSEDHYFTLNPPHVTVDIPTYQPRKPQG